MTRHDLIEYVAGDDWEILATLLDEDGQPYNFTLATSVVTWRLVDVNGVAVIGDEAQITYVDPVNGVVSVHIPAAATSPVTSGIYSDALRLAMGGEVGTLLAGPVNVIGNPWLKAEGQQAVLEYQRPRLVPKKLQQPDRVV
jgi:hypothetical protein